LVQRSVWQSPELLPPLPQLVKPYRADMTKTN
jgi:hypothetical protein